MPLKVFSRGPVVGAARINVPGALERVCEESVEILVTLIREELERSLKTAVITEKARKRIPALANLTLLIEKYLKCFSIAPVENGFQLKISRKTLQEQGLPAELPELFEHGSEMGISAVPHLQMAWMRFERDFVPKLAKKVLQ